MHRRVHLDYIGVKRFDADGNLVGESVLCGLFTSTAYTQSARAIPYLRHKVDHIISRAGFDPLSHSGKALVNVLENYPRDELFQIDEETLYQFALAILQLGERPRVRVLPRRDRFDRFVSVLVYVPRDRYDSEIRAKIANYLAAAFQGEVRAFIRFFPRARWCVCTSLLRDRGQNADRRPRHARARGRSNCTELGDGLKEALAEGPQAGAGRVLFERYEAAFPVDYRDSYPPAVGRRRYRRGRKAHRRASARGRVSSQSRRRGGRRRTEGFQPRSAHSRFPNAYQCWKTWASA